MSVLCLLLIPAAVGQAEPTPPDGVLDAARDYVEGVLDGDARRVQGAAHELLAKRRVAREYWGQPSPEWLREITREQLPGLVNYFQTTGAVSPASGAPTIDVLAWTSDSASVRATSGAGLQLLHLANLDGAWKVVDDAYDLEPGPGDGADERAVRSVVIDYARGIYERAPIKTLGSCHTSLARREVVDAEQGDMLDPMSYEELSLFTSSYNEYWDFPPRSAKREIEVLAVIDSIAAVRLDGENWTDMIHVAKLNGSWLIIDVLTVAGVHEEPE